MDPSQASNAGPFSRHRGHRSKHALWESRVARCAEEQDEPTETVTDVSQLAPRLNIRSEGDGKEAVLLNETIFYPFGGVRVAGKCGEEASPSCWRRARQTSDGRHLTEPLRPCSRHRRRPPQGQPNDTGVIEGGGARFEVSDVRLKARRHEYINQWSTEVAN